MVWNYPLGQTGGKGATNGTIRVQFDRFLAPGSANRQAFCVSMSAKPDDCLSAGSGPGTATLSVEYDPVDRVVVLKPPAKGLDVGLYKVRVLPPKNDADPFGIRAFDGVPMASEFSFEFQVDASQTPDEPNRAIDFCSAETACAMPTDPSPIAIRDSVSAFMGESCASETSCHRPTNVAEGERLPPKDIPLGLAVHFSDLKSAGGVPPAIRRIVTERLVAPETAIDPDPGAPRTSGADSFGRNMPLIDPQNPGNSYIVYKMILGTLHCPAGKTDDAVDPLSCSGDGGTYGSSAQFNADFYEYDAGGCNGTVVHHEGDRKLYAAWVPEVQWQSPVAGEYARLAYRIRGTAMPPGGGSPPQDPHLISAWIAAGAPVKDCPAGPN